MKTLPRYVWIGCCCIGLMLAASAGAASEKSRAQSREYQIKAAFIYNFLKFIEWPQPEQAHDDTEQDNSPPPLMIGVVGQSSFGSSLDELKQKKVRGRRIEICYLPSYTSLKTNDALDRFTQCQVLFVCRSQADFMGPITAVTCKHRILTISDVEDFLQVGGVIQFVVEEDKVRFKINMTAAGREELQIPSRMLRLARKVYREKGPENDNENEPESNCAGTRRPLVPITAVQSHEE